MKTKPLAHWDVKPPHQRQDPRYWRMGVRVGGTRNVRRCRSYEMITRLDSMLVGILYPPQAKIVALTSMS